MRLFFFIGIICFTVSGIIVSSLALAQNQTGQEKVQSQQSLQAQGLGVSPFIIETQVQPGQSEEQVITLTNTTSESLPIDVSINDFVPNNITGQAQFLSPEENANPAYGLSSWITVVEQPQFVIAPGEQTQIKFKITPPVDAVPGTHYGGMLFSYRPPAASPGTVVVAQKVGVLVLVKLGRANEQGIISQFFAEQAGVDDNYQFILSFHNTGNVHLKPKGEIYITNIIGQQVASVIVNKDAQIVLPESQRVFESVWKSGWRLGRYKATAVMYFGNPKLEARSEVVIWIMPWQRLLIVFALLIICVYAIRLLLQQYHKRILRDPSKKTS